MRSGILGAITFFVFAVAAGYALGGKSWNGFVYLSDGTVNGPSSTRNPAAIRRELDFSRLDGAELITATQKRLVTAAKTISKQGWVGVELGHFVTRSEDGQRRLACNASFDRLTLRFAAEGMASAGEKPTMEIDGPCLANSKDVASIEPIWIPVEKILSLAAVDTQGRFDENVSYSFKNMNGSWPVRWSLLSIRLYSRTEPNHEVKISDGELRGIRPKPFVVNWLDARRQPSSAN